MTPKFHVLKATNGDRYFYLMAANSEVILTSETYQQKQSAIKGIVSVMENAQHPENFELRTAADGKPYFVLKAANGEIIGTSETYETTQGAEKGIAAVQSATPIAEIIDRT